MGRKGVGISGFKVRKDWRGLRKDNESNLGERGTEEVRGRKR